MSHVEPVLHPRFRKRRNHDPRSWVGKASIALVSFLLVLALIGIAILASQLRGVEAQNALLWSALRTVSSQSYTMNELGK